jgi:hypothetical protein
MLSPNGKYALVSETETKTTNFLIDLQSGTIVAKLNVPSLKDRELSLNNESTSYVFKETRFSDDGSTTIV